MSVYKKLISVYKLLRKKTGPGILMDDRWNKTRIWQSSKRQYTNIINKFIHGPSYVNHNDTDVTFM